MTHDHDVIIVGAGFVGLTLAFAYALQGKQVALIEAKTLNEKKQVIDSRAIALSFKSKQILEQLTIWQHLNPVPITKVNVSEQGAFGKLYLTAKELGHEALGYVIRAQQLGETLLNLCVTQKNITWFSPAILEEITQDSQKITAHLKDHSAISADLLIIAEGAHSLTRTQQAFSTWTRDYQQTAIVANVSLTTATSSIAYQRFTPEGTVALLPLNDKRFTLVWTVPEAQGNTLSDEDFLKKIQTLMGYQLGSVYDLGLRQAYPLKAIFVEKAYEGRLLLMGNAAHTLNPIAAQGFNLTLRDILYLLSAHSLADYQAQRLTDQKNMLRFTDGLVDLLALPYPLRSLGLSTINYLPFVKKRLFAHLLGY